MRQVFVCDASHKIGKTKNARSGTTSSFSSFTFPRNTSEQFTSCSQKHKFNNYLETERSKQIMTAKISLILFALPLLANGFPTVPNSKNNQQLATVLSASNTDENYAIQSRRSFLITAGMAFAGVSGLPEYASAGIDVSGLRVEGGGSGNPSLASQLKAYDGSGSARVREIKEMSTPSPSPLTTSLGKIKEADDKSPFATWAYRYNPGMGASLSRAGTFGNLYRYNDLLVAPSDSKRGSIGVQFEFPSDWLQLDRQIGGIQYVDQRNGDKLYVFRAPLPTSTTTITGEDGSTETTTTTTSLASLSKSVIGDLIFDPNGSFVKTGQTIEDYKVSSAQILSECSGGMCATRRRFKIKFATVTGNGLRVERRGLVDAYQVDNDIYMMMTSSNAVKFEQKESRERETVENIVASFQVEA